MSEFTGERLVPGEVDADLWNEHISRYAFAAAVIGADASGGVKRVIDAGCGTGYGTRLLAVSAHRVLGIDIAQPAIEYAARQYGGAKVRFLIGSVDSLPVPAGSADAVVAFEVIEHLEKWREFLAEVRRALTPEGLLIVSTPNKRYYTESRGEAGPNPFHVHEFDYGEFFGALGEHFGHVQIFGQNHTGVVSFTGSGDADSAIYRESLAADPASAAFFVGVCSQALLPRISSYFYVPKTFNTLREREQHIRFLSGEVEQLHREHTETVDRARAQKLELERSNEWAKSLDRELRERGDRIAALQLELEVANRWALNVQEESDQRAARIVDLQTEVADAQAAITRLSAELAERSETARRLESTLAMYRESRWTRLGGKLHVGPLAHG